MTPDIFVDQKTVVEMLAAKYLADALSKTIDAKGRAVFGVSSEVSAYGTLSKLASLPVLWERVHIFFIDEFAMSIENAKSSFKFVYDFLLRKIIADESIAAENVHPFIYDETAHDFGARAYSKTLGDHGGKFDVVLLAAGEDGHIASLFPNHEAIADDAYGYIPVRNAPHEPESRVTASRALLTDIETGALLFIGEDKEYALARYKDDGPIENVPARIVKTFKDAIVFTDVNNF